MKTTLQILFLLPFIVACTYLPGDCPDGINLLPMYGSVKKCRAQIKADSVFLHTCDTAYHDRKEAARYFVSRGWQYYYKNTPDTAMMRFNQAWLLDSLNADVYWGFGNLLGTQKKYRESLPMFNRALQLDPLNAKIYESASSSFGQLYVQTRNTSYLNMAVKYLKSAIKLQPTARAYGQLTTAYVYFTQKDSARKYMKITDAMDPKAVNPEVRKMITGQ